MLFRRTGTVRSEYARKPSQAQPLDYARFRRSGASTSLLIAFAFLVIASAILMLRQDVLPYRVGQWISHDIVSRVRFTFDDRDQLQRLQRQAGDRTPDVFNVVPNIDVWSDLNSALQAVVEQLPQRPGEKLPDDIRQQFDGGAETALLKYATPDGRLSLRRKIESFVGELRDYRVTSSTQRWPIIILDKEARTRELRLHRGIRIGDAGVLDASRTFYPGSDELRAVLNDAAQKHFVLALQPKVADFALAHLQQPTHALDVQATAQATRDAISSVPESSAQRDYPADCPLVIRTKDKQAIDPQDWQLLRAEHNAYVRSLKTNRLEGKGGIVLLALMMTIVLSAYVARYQPRVIKNHARALAIAGLMLSMLLLNQLAALSNGPLYLFGVAPTLLVAMIITIAYDQRTAIGVASMHGILATVALNEGIAFFVILWVGVLVSCFMLDEIRTRSKLIEVGGAAAIAMALATAAAGLLAYDPWPYIFQNCMYSGAAGLGVGFIVLGILPFVEKTFRITTSMTLLELADASQPLLRRLAVEAPGTYNHSLQVATLSEAAAEAIGADSLLCRVAAYYHDVGKVKKADYFVENQSGRENRHLNLNPSVSLLIIIGHVKDGMELAREHNLPTNLLPFIQQHHGTTLVEYFYHQARTQHDQQQPDHPAISETQYRYPGPKPRSREVAIVMLADAVESATRAMGEPTASRVEGLVHDLAMKRLMDGQFNECDLTMHDLELIQRSMIKTILAIHHGRIAYPATATSPQKPSGFPVAAGAVKSA